DLQAASRVVRSCLALVTHSPRAAVQLLRQTLAADAASAGTLPSRPSVMAMAGTNPAATMDAVAPGTSPSRRIAGAVGALPQRLRVGPQRLRRCQECLAQRLVELLPRRQAAQPVHVLDHGPLDLLEARLRLLCVARGAELATFARAGMALRDRVGELRLEGAEAGL